MRLTVYTEKKFCLATPVHSHRLNNFAVSIERKEEKPHQCVKIFVELDE